MVLTAAALLASMAQASSASSPAEATTIVAPSPVSEPVTEAADRAAAAEAAARQGGPVESLADRTETSTTWVNADGTTKTDYFGAPIRFRDSAGQWRDVDISLVQRPDGTIAPKAHPESLKFAPAGGTADTVHKLASLDGGEVVLGWKGTLPTPVIDGFTATYPEVQPGVDLVLTATRTGFEQYFIIKERPEPGEAPTFRLPVTGDEVSVKETTQGGLAVVDDTGAKVAVAPVPMMWGDEISATSGEPAEQAVVDMTVNPTASGGEVVLKPDPAFLADADITYPLIVDPAVVVYTSSDTLIQNDLNSNQNGGVELKAGSYNGGSTKARSLIKFHVADLRSDAGTEVLEADFYLYNTYSSSCTKTPVGLHRIYETWSPANVTWTSGAPAHIQTPFVSVTDANGYNANCPADYIHFNNEGLRSLVEQWISGATPNYGFMIRAGNENDSLSWKRFHSADYGGTRVPRLSITYNKVPYQPVGRKVSTCQTCAHTTVVNVPRPLLWGNAKDDDGGSVRMDFEIWDGGTQSPTARRTYGSKTVTVTAGAATPVAWTPPIDLPDGTYAYRARAWDGQHYSAWSDGYVIFVVDTPGTPTGLAPTWNAEVDGLEPELSGVVSGSGELRGEFEVRDSLTGEILVNSELPNEDSDIIGSSVVASGQLSTYSVPADHLLSGHPYEWRMRTVDSLGAKSSWTPYQRLGNPPLPWRHEL
ncbi:DNRLRE domain-containing protein [Sporichthya polymorpha]|uniref:DNRLRE domain-containing protein n=1 Tax=Sporichthya polymorpha TaxID=35751 RepID=UPI00146EDABF|nr:DNRLRE domain-containing protein [Sporichthya polymorpha]